MDIKETQFRNPKDAIQEEYPFEVLDLIERCMSEESSEMTQLLDHHLDRNEGRT